MHYEALQAANNHFINDNYEILIKLYLYFLKFRFFILRKLYVHEFAISVFIDIKMKKSYKAMELRSDRTYECQFNLKIIEIQGCILQ